MSRADESPWPEPVPPDDNQYLNELRGWMENTIGIKDGGRLPDSDWMLIITLHAMIESALNGALVIQFSAPDLGKIISKMDTSNPATGKIAFAKALNILTGKSAAFVQKLSELRNLCVHNIRNFDFDLVRHLSELEPRKRKDLLNAIASEIQPDVTVVVSKVEMKADQLVSEKPKAALIAAVMNVMIQLHAHYNDCVARDLKNELYRKKSDKTDEFLQR